MRIGIDARCLEWQRGGVARFLTNMLRLWPEITSSHEYVLYFQNSIPQDSFLNHPSFIKRVCTGPSILRKKRILAEQILFPKMIANDHLDLYFATWYSAPLNMKGPKSVIADWDISYSTHPQHYSFFDRHALDYFSRKSSQKADGIITCSDYDAQQIETFYKIPKDKICTVYFSADSKFSPSQNTDAKNQLKKKYSLPEHYLLHMGLIYNRRSIDTLIEAYKKIEDEYPNMSLVIIGKNASNPRIDVQGLLRPLIDRKKAVYLEWIPDSDIVEFYRSAHFYICTSTVDGETIMLKEAMQCGTPVISSTLLKQTIGGNGRIIKNPTDVNETAMELKAALNMSETERKRMIEEGVRWVAQFSWEKVAQKSLNFFLSV